MSEPITTHHYNLAVFILANSGHFSLSEPKAKAILQGIRDNAETSTLYKDALNELRNALHRHYKAKTQKRVGISVGEVCTLLDLGQKTVQELKEKLGYDPKLPHAERYDYHLVHDFGIYDGGGKAGRLVHTFANGGVIVGTFLGTPEQLDEIFASGARLSLMTVPDMLASRWQNSDELEMWSKAYLGVLEEVRRQLD